MSLQNQPFQADQDEMFTTNISKRQRNGRIWLIVFQLSTIVGILALSALLYNIINDLMGYMAFETKVDPNSLTGGRPLENLTEAELIQIPLGQPVGQSLPDIEHGKTDGKPLAGRAGRSGRY